MIKKNSGGAVKSEIMSNQKLPEELYKPIIRKFVKQKIYSSFKKYFGCWFGRYTIHK